MMHRAAGANLLLYVLLTAAPTAVVGSRQTIAARANPIRKVVTMLQAMQKKVTAEGVKEAELYEKFDCYCRNGAGELSKSISEAETKAPLLASDISSAEAKKKQLDGGLKAHQA